MEFTRERPPAYSSDLKLPSVPNHDVPTNGHTNHNISLPDLRSLGLPDAQRHSNEWSPPQHYRQNGQLNPSAFPSVPSAPPRTSHELPQPLGSPMATESVLSSEDRTMRAPSVMSMDDPDTRMAVEALSGLKNPEFMRSPSARSTTLSNYQGMQPYSPPLNQQEEVEEPLLSLVTSSHPWLGATINGSVATYNFSKNWSPAIIRNGAEFVERNVGSTLRRTGVEGGVRRYLGDRRPSDLDTNEARRKRAREMSPGKDVEQGMSSPPAVDQRRSRTGSQASFVSLPPYDENKSPRYEEMAATAITSPDPETQRPLTPSRNWRTQLVITTSGLSAALSETSLRNLRFCLNLLKGATESITTMMVALKKLLDDYEESRGGVRDQSHPGYTLTQEQEAASSRIAEQIRATHRDIMKTLEQIKNSISQYAGAALPENAGALVRRQLMSIPQRWRVAESQAAESQPTESSQAVNVEVVKGGKTLVGFASQSLDMLAQITMIVGETIQSAEGWLSKMGRSRGNGRERGRSLRSEGHATNGVLPYTDDKRIFETNGDVNMREKH